MYLRTSFGKNTKSKLFISAWAHCLPTNTHDRHANVTLASQCYHIFIRKCKINNFI